MKRALPPDMPDEELMLLYKLGDFEAFEELYRRYAPKLYGYLQQRLRGAAADDLFQEVFLKLHRNRGRYKKNSPFAPWLFTITRNCLIDAFRRQGRPGQHLSVEQIAAEQAPQAADPPPHEQGWGLEQLSERDAAIIRLRFGDDLSFDEIGRRLSIKAAAARKRCSRAIERLRALLK